MVVVYLFFTLNGKNSYENAVEREKERNIPLGLNVLFRGNVWNVQSIMVTMLLPLPTSNHDLRTVLSISYKENKD